MQSLGIRAAVPSGRTKVIDLVPPGSVNIILITFSCNVDPEWELYFDKDIADLAIPGQPSLTAATTGGNLLASTPVFVRITALDANNKESPPSNGYKTVTVGAGTNTNKVTASWSAVSGAASYNVYAGRTSGAETLIANTASTSYVITDLDLSTTIIPTLPDITVIGKKFGIDSIPISGDGITVSARLIAYVNLVGAGSDVAIAMLAE